MEEVTKPEFSVNKSYTWEPTTQFSLSGQEFGLVHRYLMDFLTSPFSPATSMKVSEVFAVMQSKLKLAVENGEATELKKEILNTEEIQVPESSL